MQMKFLKFELKFAGKASSNIYTLQCMYIYCRYGGKLYTSYRYINNMHANSDTAKYDNITF